MKPFIAFKNAASHQSNRRTRKFGSCVAAFCGAVLSLAAPAFAGGVILGGPEAPRASDATTEPVVKSSDKSSSNKATPSALPPTFPAAGNRMAQFPTTPGTLGGGSNVATSGGEAANNSSVPTALGPLPIDLGQVRQIRIAGQPVGEAPLRVGNVDVLAPIVGDGSSILQGLGVSATRAAVQNIPGNINTPSDAQSFQINLPEGPPVVLTVGKAVAYVGSDERPLRAAPLVINGKIWLPIFSLAPMLGASTRLNPADGTLHVNPTIQSVDLFPAKGYTVMTVKASAPLKTGVVKMGTVGSPPKVYFDFSGYSMGFDAAGTTGERVVSPGLNEVQQARAGMVESFPDITRVVLDLKKKVKASVQQLPDKTLYAIVLSPTGYVPTPGPTPTPIYDPKQTLQGVRIVVDAGHGGHDGGASGARSKEKDHTLDISRRLRRHLEAKGANVFMSRDGDYFISLQGRVDYAHSRDADIFFSVHINSFRSSSSGTETFFYTGHSAALAREVHNELVKATGLPNRGVSQARFYVIRNTRMPSVLTETAFISNPREEAKLVSPAYREKVAKGMAQGISNYVARYGVSR